MPVATLQEMRALCHAHVAACRTGDARGCAAAFAEAEETAKGVSLCVCDRGADGSRQIRICSLTATGQG